MSSSVETLGQLVTIDADDVVQATILRRLAQSDALLRGHFALHRGRHSTTALRFRSVGRDAAFMRMVVDAIVARAPDGLSHAFADAKVLTPESSGLFLGRALAERYSTSHLVAQTDLRRLPMKALLSGAIQPNDRVLLVNDVASTGASLDPLRQLVTERGGLAVGVVLFAVVGDDLESYCARWRLPSRWLVTARWKTYDPDGCPGCQAGEPLTPVAEFV